MGLFVDLVGIQPGGEDQRAIHESSSPVGEEDPREVQQCVECQDDAVLVSVAVPSLGGVIERMSVASAYAAVSDDPAQDTSGRVRSETEDQFPDQVVSVFGIVETRKVVYLLQFVIDESGDTGHIISAVFRRDDVLALQFHDLVGVRKGVSVPVVRISQFVSLFDIEADLARFEVCQRDIGHIVADGPVPEDGYVVLPSQDAFLE